MILKNLPISTLRRQWKLNEFNTIFHNKNFRAVDEYTSTGIDKVKTSYSIIYNTIILSRKEFFLNHRFEENKGDFTIFNKQIKFNKQNEEFLAWIRNQKLNVHLSYFSYFDIAYQNNNYNLVYNEESKNKSICDIFLEITNDTTFHLDHLD
jgi:hypothetical protein